MIEAFFQRRFVPIVNTETHEIPPHGIVEIDDTEYDADTGEVIWKIKRPTADGVTNILINSHQKVFGSGEPKKKYGMATMDFPAVVKMDDNSATVGQIWGAQTDSYLAKKGVGGFIVCSGEITSSHRMVQRVPAGGIVFCYVSTTAITAASGTAPNITLGTGTVSIYNSNDFSTAVQTGVTIKNALKTASGTERIVIGAFDSNGTLFYIADYCG